MLAACRWTSGSAGSAADTADTSPARKPSSASGWPNPDGCDRLQGLCKQGLSEYRLAGHIGHRLRAVEGVEAI